MCSVCLICRSTLEDLHECELQIMVSRVPIRIGLSPIHLSQEITSQMDLRLGWQMVMLFLRHSYTLPPILLLRNIFWSLILSVYGLGSYIAQLLVRMAHSTFLFTGISFDPTHNPYWRTSTRVPTGFWSHTYLGLSSVLPLLVKWLREITNTLSLHLHCKMGIITLSVS